MERRIDLLSILSADDAPASLDLTGMIFENSIAIKGIVIKSCIEFGDSVFRQRISFERCTFQQELNSFRTCFQAEVDFSDCTFEKAVAFRPSKISFLNLRSAIAKDDIEISIPDGCNASLDLSYATLYKFATIKSLNHNTPAFLKPVSADTVNIENTSIEPNATFVVAGITCQCLRATGLILREKSSFSLEDFNPGMLYLYDMKLSATATVTMSRVSLERAFFTGSNVEKFRFSNVIWPVYETRQALWQELWLRRSPEEAQQDQKAKSIRVLFEEVAENYRQLVLNYEAQRNYELAEKFHMGEMELTRLQQAERLPKWLGKARGILNLHWIYRISSSYGTNYTRAGLILVGILFVFSAAFLFSGFKDKNQVDTEYYLQLFHSDLPASSLSEVAHDWTKSLAMTLAIVTLQKERPAEPKGLSGSILISLMTICTSAQATLFVFALRRRFRRASI